MNGSHNMVVAVFHVKSNQHQSLKLQVVGWSKGFKWVRLMGFIASTFMSSVYFSSAGSTDSD